MAAPDVPSRLAELQCSVYNFPAGIWIQACNLPHIPRNPSEHLLLCQWFYTAGKSGAQNTISLSPRLGGSYEQNQIIDCKREMKRKRCIYLF